MIINNYVTPSIRGSFEIGFVNNFNPKLFNLHSGRVFEQAHFLPKYHKMYFTLDTTVNFCQTKAKQFKLHKSL